MKLGWVLLSVNKRYQFVRVKADGHFKALLRYMKRNEEGKDLSYKFYTGPEDELDSVS